MPAGTRIEIESELYAADAESLLRRLRRLPQGLPSVLLIGHSPSIESLALGLAGSGDDPALERMASKYPTGALSTLGFDGRWSELSWATAGLERFVVPRELK
jgi:phosphohistidine phosphatase